MEGHIEKFQKSEQREGARFIIRCVSCHREISVASSNFVRFGGSYVVSTCPECGKLAYNHTEMPNN